MYIKGKDIEKIKNDTDFRTKFAACLERYTEIVNYGKKKGYTDELNYDLYELVDLLYKWYLDLSKAEDEMVDEVTVLYNTVNEIYTNKKFPLSCYYTLAEGFSRCFINKMKDTWIENEYFNTKIQDVDFNKKSGMFEKGKKNKLLAPFRITNTEFEELVKVVYDYAMSNRTVISEEDCDHALMIIIVNSMHKILERSDDEGFVKYTITNYLETIQNYRLEI